MAIASDLLQRHVQTLVEDNAQWQTLIADDLLWELVYAPSIGHPAVSRRDQRTLPPDPGPRGGRQVPVERQAGKRPLLARWGGISRSRTRQVILHDAPRRSGGPRPALAARLLADPGARCTAQAAVPVHHVRALQALRREGRAERPFAVTVMAAR